MLYLQNLTFSDAIIELGLALQANQWNKANFFFSLQKRYFRREKNNAKKIFAATRSIDPKNTKSKINFKKYEINGKIIRKDFKKCEISPVTN